MVTQKQIIILTGGTGLIGSQLLERLSSFYPNIKVKALVRQLPSIRYSCIDYIQGDLRSNIPVDLFSEPSILFHFAHTHHAKSIEVLRETNVEGLKNLLKAAKGNISKIVHGSSMSVYGQGPFEDVKEEESLHPTTDLARTRLEAELVIKDFCEKQNIPSIIFRPRFLFSPNERETIPKLFKQFKKGVMIDSGKQRFSYIHLDDYVQIIIESLKLNTSHIFNVGYIRPISLNEIYQHLGSFHLRYKVPSKLLRKFCSVIGMKKLKTQLELIGQNQILNVEKLYTHFPFLNEIDAIEKTKLTIESIKRAER